MVFIHETNNKCRRAPVTEEDWTKVVFSAWDHKCRRAPVTEEDWTKVVFNAWDHKCRRAPVTGEDWTKVVFNACHGKVWVFVWIVERRKNSRWARQTLFLSKKFRLLAGHDYPVNLMTDSVLNLMCK